MNFLSFLEDSAFSDWLLVSMWGFPSLIALHSVGMAVVVGLSLIIALRLNGWLDVIDAPLLSRLVGIAGWGFVLNFLTGLALFITRGSEYITAAMFLAKMLLVLASAGILFWLGFRFRQARPSSGVLSDDRPARALSVIAATLWFAAVVAGRLIAYLSDLYRPGA